MARTSQEQHDIILELLRTRNLGGGQQGVMEWGGSRPGSEIPLSGDHFKVAFGDHEEARSRELVEWAIRELAHYDYKAYIAINGVFDRDVGGFRDLEFFSLRSPELAAHAERGVWLLTAKLMDHKLYASPSRPMTPAEHEKQATKNRAVFDTWTRRKAEGAKSKDIVAELHGTYGVSERRIYQILEQEAPPEDRGEAKRGRPRKNFA